MINNEIKEYIENNIFPKYSKNDTGHNLNHINYVINRSLEFAKEVDDINLDMVYVIAAYHDIGHRIDAKNHEKVSSDIFLKDENIQKFFNDEQIKIMSEAIIDHRASLEGDPRTIYGKIVSSADRNTSIDDDLKRTYTYRIVNAPTMPLEEMVEESRKHLKGKYCSDSYAQKKMYFNDISYKTFLNELNELVNNKEKFKEEFYKANEINDLNKNIRYIVTELKKSKEQLSKEDFISCVYVKLNTSKTKEELRNMIEKEMKM